MAVRRRGVNLHLTFHVNNTAWIEERGWETSGISEGVRCWHFDIALMDNITAVIACHIIDQLKPEFHQRVAKLILPRLQSEGEITADHLGLEFWCSIDDLLEVEITMSMLNIFGPVCASIRAQLQEALDRAYERGVQGLTDWSHEVRVVLPVTTFELSMYIPATHYSLVHGKVRLHTPIPVCWQPALAPINTIEYILDDDVPTMLEWNAG